MTSLIEFKQDQRNIQQFHQKTGSFDLAEENLMMTKIHFSCHQQHYIFMRLCLFALRIKHTYTLTTYLSCVCPPLASA